MILLMLLPTIITANSTLMLNDKETSYTDFKVDYLIEADGQFLDIDDIQEVTFNEPISNKINLGYHNNEIWFRVNIHNTTSDDKNMILAFTEVFNEVVDLFVISEKTTYQKNGLQIPVQKRKIQESAPSFPLSFQAGESKEIYLKVASTHGIFGAIEVKNEEEFYKDIQVKKYLYLAYLVAVATIILYNLIYFLYFRDKIYFYYIAYVLLFAVWIANFKGLLLPFINTSIFNTLQLIIPMFYIALLLFSQAILETQKHHEKLHKIYDVIMYSTILIIILMIVSPENGLYVLNLLSIPLLLTTLGAAIWLLDTKSMIARLYILALSIFILGMIVISVLALGLGLIPYNSLVSNFIVLVSIVEIILFSLLLAYRINLVRKESFESREQLLEQQKSESTRLFHTVAEKTKELNRAKKEIEEELRKKIELEKHLQHLASTDPMTELYNRRAFFDISDLEVSGAKSNEDELTCLVIDIDHFKKVNDTYGHDVGDTVITAVSKLMVLNTRTKDHIGRIGGEEFAVLMPKTNAEAAYQIADRLRENISKHTIAIDNHDSIKITVSIGLSTLSNDGSETIHTLLKRADTALYKAKHNGRNQVCCLPKKNEEKS